MPSSPVPLRVALLDLYAGKDNHGLSALRRAVDAAGRRAGVPVRLDTYDVRGRGDVPDLAYDLFVSSGGPGSPYDGEGTAWEADYFRWLDRLWNHNERSPAPRPALFICHSFQMMVRFFEVARVTRRESESFGVVPVNRTEAGRRDPLLAGLDDPFYGADFRHWQAVEPDASRLSGLDARVLAVETDRPEAEGAVMALRVGEHLAAVQFHPEAEPAGMADHVRRPERRRQVIEKVGLGGYRALLRRLRDPHVLKPTHDAVLPGFLDRAVRTVGGPGRRFGPLPGTDPVG
jgi:GMP synthase-like glutamine amidotransferase